MLAKVEGVAFIRSTVNAMALEGCNVMRLLSNLKIKGLEMMKRRDECTRPGFSAGNPLVHAQLASRFGYKMNCLFLAIEEMDSRVQRCKHVHVL